MLTELSSEKFVWFGSSPIEPFNQGDARQSARGEGPRPGPAGVRAGMLRGSVPQRHRGPDILPRDVSRVCCLRWWPRISSVRAQVQAPLIARVWFTVSYLCETLLFFFIHTVVIRIGFHFPTFWLVRTKYTFSSNPSTEIRAWEIYEIEWNRNAFWRKLSGWP